MERLSESGLPTSCIGVPRALARNPHLITVPEVGAQMILVSLLSLQFKFIVPGKRVAWRKKK